MINTLRLFFLRFSIFYSRKTLRKNFSFLRHTSLILVKQTLKRIDEKNLDSLPVWAEILIFTIGLSEIGLLCDILGHVFSRPWHKSYSKSVKLKVGHVYGALETCAWLGIHINAKLFLFLFFEYSVEKKIAWRKSEGAIAPSAPPWCCRACCLDVNILQEPSA